MPPAFTRTFATALLVAAAIACAAGAASAAETLTPVEGRFAELAKLPAAERTAALVEAAKKEGKLVMLPIMQSRIGHNHTQLFAKQAPFLKLEYMDIGSDEMAERFLVEETAGRHLTDLVSLSIPDMYHIVTKKLTARNQTPATDAILPAYASFKHPEHLWVPAYWKEHGISYNPNMLKAEEAPKTWMDLCKPEYKGMASYEVAHNPWAVGMYFVFGKDEKKLEEFFACVGRNEPILVNGHTSRLTLMLAGDHSIQGENALYNGTVANMKNPKKAPFKGVYTAEVLAYASVMSIGKHAPNPMAAALYADWVLSQESQEFIAKEYRSPITLPHPYMPPEAMIVNVPYVADATSDRIMALWTKSTAKR